MYLSVISLFYCVFTFFFFFNLEFKFSILSLTGVAALATVYLQSVALILEAILTVQGGFKGTMLLVI